MRANQRPDLAQGSWDRAPGPETTVVRELDASGGDADLQARSTPRRRERGNHRIVEGCDLPRSAISDEDAQVDFCVRELKPVLTRGEMKRSQPDGH